MATEQPQLRSFRRDGHMRTIDYTVGCIAYCLLFFFEKIEQTPENTAKYEQKLDWLFQVMEELNNAKVP